MAGARRSRADGGNAPEDVLTNGGPFAEVRAFYRAHPFPDFGLGKYVIREDLYRHANPYTLLLDANLPVSASVLDLGCGTGQLANLLALKGRRVVGVDFSEVSLARAQSLKERLQIETCEFRVGNLHDLAPRDGEKFDVILCNGVVPCLEAPEEVLPRLWKAFGRSGTECVVGLYHSFGRTMFRLRRTAGDQSSVDAMLVKRESDPVKIDSWIADQCTPPVERCYRTVHVRQWFARAGVEWLRSFPPLPGDPPEHAGLFPAQPARPVRWLSNLAELAWAWRLRATGGYFVVAGRIR